MGDCREGGWQNSVAPHRRHVCGVRAHYTTNPAGLLSLGSAGYRFSGSAALRDSWSQVAGPTGNAALVDSSPSALISLALVQAPTPVRLHPKAYLRMLLPFYFPSLTLFFLATLGIPLASVYRCMQVHAYVVLMCGPSLVRRLPSSAREGPDVSIVAPHCLCIALDSAGRRRDGWRRVSGRRLFAQIAFPVRVACHRARSCDPRRRHSRRPPSASPCALAPQAVRPACLLVKGGADATVARAGVQVAGAWRVGGGALTGGRAALQHGRDVHAG